MSAPATKAKLASIIRKHSGLSRDWFTRQEIETMQKASLIVLGLIAVAGVAAISIAAPNVLKAVGPLLKNRNRSGVRLGKREKEIKTAQVFYYLKRSGLIHLKASADDLLASLTNKGEDRLAKIKFDLIKPKLQKTWNGKWWQVAADIPTKDYRIAADYFRKKIKQMGFYPLQRTLWFYPFDPRREIQATAEYYGIQNFVTVMEVSRLDVEDEEAMRLFFKACRIL